MATLYPTAHVNASASIPSAYPRSLPSNSTIKRKTLPRLRCALPRPPLRSRRLVSFSLLLSHLFFVPNHVNSPSFLDKYLKKKKLDPLEAFVPAVILTQLQIKDLEKTVEVDEPQFASFQSLLRSGPAASLPAAQYASDAGSGKTAFNDVDLCLRALEELNSLLLHASRNDPEASVKSMKAKVDVTLDALESLLQTVPPDVLDKGKAVADAYRSSQEEAEPQVLDPELRELGVNIVNFLT